MKIHSALPASQGLKIEGDIKGDTNLGKTVKWKQKQKR